MRSRRRGLLLGGLLVLCLWSAVAGEALAQPAAREYDVKAALLFNFSQFVEWPEAAMPGAREPFVIGILGTDPFGSALDDLVANERVQGHAIEIRRYRSVEEVSSQILFVGYAERRRLGATFEVLNGKPILTVIEYRGTSFEADGGMIALVTDGGNIRLLVNLNAVRAAGLVISAKVLQLADVVGADAR